MYLLKALKFPIARYVLDGLSESCLVSDNLLYLNGGGTLHVFKIKASLTEPLEAVTKIYISNNHRYPKKIARIGSELVLGMCDGVLSLLDIESCKITHSHRFQEASVILDFIVLEASHFLLAANKGVFKVTKSEVIKQSFKDEWIARICHATDSVYLLNLLHKKKLIVWNEHSDEQLFEIDTGLTVYSMRRMLST